MNNMRKIVSALFAAVLIFTACGNRDFRVKGDRVEINRSQTTVRLQVVSPEIIRVSTVPSGSKFSDRKSLVVLPKEETVDFKVNTSGDTVFVATSDLTAYVDSQGNVGFMDSDGKQLAGDGNMTFKPVEVEGKKGFSVLTRFPAAEDESFYGLGQHQAGEFDHRGRSEELYQYNTKVSVPFVVSTKGYGVLFDAYSLSRWGNPEPYRQLGGMFKLFDKEGVEGALTGTY